MAVIKKTKMALLKKIKMAVIKKTKMALLKKIKMVVIKKTKMALLKKTKMAVIKKTKMALLKKMKMVVIKKTKIKIEQEKQENIMVIVDSVIYSRLSDTQSVYGESICQYKFSLRTQGEYTSINQFVYLVQQAFLTLTAEKTKTQGQKKNACL